MSAITPAASVLLARGPGADEVFLVRRAPTLRFMGGFTAFPGGKVHASDADLARADPALTDRHVAAVRELFEETGILLARKPDGSFPLPSPDWTGWRKRLLEGHCCLSEMLAALDLHLNATDLLPVGSLVTPAFAPLRFDTAFFVADCPPGQEPDVWPGELDSGFWASADDALRGWERGESLLSPPTTSLLQSIRGRPVHELPHRARPLLERLSSGAMPPIWFAPGVLMVPLHCNGLPPTTHTNAFLVGTGPVYLLDPGPADPAEQEVLFAVLEEQRSAGRAPDAVVLTHHHPDHIGAASTVAARYHIPVLAHPLTARALEGKVRVDQLLEDGATLDLGIAPHGNGRWQLQALHTPGHAQGHLAFWEPGYGLLFAGDMVSTISSVVIAPPEGDLAIYLASLRRLQSLPARLLLPAHGGASARPGFVLAEAISHRARREEQLLAALAQPRTLQELTLELYRGLPEGLFPFAEIQTQAGLLKLLHEGKACEHEGRWQVVN